MTESRGINWPSTRGTPTERLWSKIAVGEPEECWPWLAGIDKRKGYGIFQAGEGRPGHTRRAHIVAWEEVNGLVPKGKELDHTCHSEDTACFAGSSCPHRRCCNPAHLEAVTHQENIRRGRGRRTREVTHG